MSWTDMALNGRILVVDDAMENIQILHGALQDEHEVLFALDGAKALALARAQRPDLILLDAVMPGMDGYEVMATLRAEAATADIPVIFVTALKSPEDETRALDAGAADFIGKPVNAAVVRARVRTQLTVKRQADALRAMTLTDSLTGAANRRAFTERIEAEWRRCARAQLPLALILADVDHFKKYNDRYGHVAGDDCLRLVAGAIRSGTRRPTDLAARYGGEEFAGILPDTTPEQARAHANAIRAHVAALNLPHAPAAVRPYVTLSIGVAGFDRERLNEAPALIEAADKALYAAKRGGRDRVVVDGDALQQAA